MSHNNLPSKLKPLSAELTMRSGLERVRCISKSISLKRSHRALKEHDLNVKPFKTSSGTQSGYSHTRLGIDKSGRMKPKYLLFSLDVTNPQKKRESTNLLLASMLSFREISSLMLISHLMFSLAPFLGDVANTHKEEGRVEPKKAHACKPRKVEAWRKFLRRHTVCRWKQSSRGDVLTQRNSRAKQFGGNERNAKGFSAMTRRFSCINKHTSHTCYCYNRDTPSLSDDFDDDDDDTSEYHGMLSNLNVENIRERLSFFFNSCDMEEELFDFQSSLEEEMNEFGILESLKNLGDAIMGGFLLSSVIKEDPNNEWGEKLKAEDAGLKSAEENLGEVSKILHFDNMMGGLHRKKSSEVQELRDQRSYHVKAELLEWQQRFDEELDMANTIIEEMYKISTVERNRMFQFTKSLIEEVHRTMLNVRASMAKSPNVSDDTVIQYKRINAAIYKILAEALVELNDLPKVPLPDLTEKQNDLLDGTGCGFDFLGDELHSLLVSRNEAENLFVDQPDELSHLNLLTEAAPTEPNEVGYWKTGPGEEPEEF